MDNNHIRPY